MEKGMSRFMMRVSWFLCCSDQQAANRSKATARVLWPCLFRIIHIAASCPAPNSVSFFVRYLRGESVRYQVQLTQAHDIIITRKRTNK